MMQACRETLMAEVLQSINSLYLVDMQLIRCLIRAVQLLSVMH